MNEKQIDDVQIRTSQHMDGKWITDSEWKTNDVRMEDRSVGGQCTENKWKTNGHVQTHSEQLEITRNRVADIINRTEHRRS